MNVTKTFFMVGLDWRGWSHGFIQHIPMLNLQSKLHLWLQYPLFFLYLTLSMWCFAYVRLEYKKSSEALHLNGNLQRVQGQHTMKHVNMCLYTSEFDPLHSFFKLIPSVREMALQLYHIFLNTNLQWCKWRVTGNTSNGFDEAGKTDRGQGNCYYIQQHNVKETYRTICFHKEMGVLFSFSVSLYKDQKYSFHFAPYMPSWMLYQKYFLVTWQFLTFFFCSPVNVDSCQKQLYSLLSSHEDTSICGYKLHTETSHLLVNWYPFKQCCMLHTK